MPASSFTLDDIYVYIFSWKRVTGNALRLYEAVSPHFPHTYFINCDEHMRITSISGENVIQLDDRYYYGGQFQTAIRHAPRGKIVACIVGDVSPEADWARISTNSVAAFNLGSIGIYAPDVYYTYWTMRQAHIVGDLYEVENPDCTCWFVHPVLIDALRSLEYFSLSNIGWGIDTIHCTEARARRLHVARDYSVKVTQPKGTSYNQTFANLQMHLLTAAYNALRSKTNKST